MSQFIRRTSTLTDVSFSDAVRSETRMPLEGAEGPCPFDQSHCYRICSAQGYHGGYCHGWFNAICKCY
jgi:Arthropod defensin.